MPYGRSGQRFHNSAQVPPNSQLTCRTLPGKLHAAEAASACSRTIACHWPRCTTPTRTTPQRLST